MTFFDSFIDEMDKLGAWPKHLRRVRRIVELGWGPHGPPALPKPLRKTLPVSFKAMGALPGPLPKQT